MKFGLDLEMHRTKPFREAMFTSGDLIIAMEPGHVARINDQFVAVAGRTVLLGMWLRDPQPYLFDPYGMQDSDFERCFASIKLATQLMVRDHWGY